MDFKSLIGKLDSIEAPEKTPQAPTLPKSAQLNEDAELRVLAGQSTVLVESELMEKAVSKSQQKAAGAALAAKRGDGKAVGASKDMMKMSTKELEKIAGTKHKGLPEKKDESVKEGAIDDLLDKQKTDKDSDDSGRRKHSGTRYGGSAQKDDEDNPEAKKDRKTAKESVELDIEEFNDKFSTMVEAAKKAPAKKTDAKGAMDKMFGGSAKDLTKNLTAKKKDEKVAEGAKPDFLDLDGDGDRKEPMKKAAADKKKGAVAKKKVGESVTTEAYINSAKDAIDILAAIRAQSKAAEQGQGDAVRPTQLVNDLYDVMQWIDSHMKSMGEGQVDELSPGTLDSYKRKTDKDAYKMVPQPGAGGMSTKDRDTAQRKSNNRVAGRNRADNKIIGKSLQGMFGEDSNVAEGKSAAQKAAQEKFKAMVSKKKGDTTEKTEESKMMPKGKKRPVKESVERRLTFKEMMKLVVESGGQQQIDPTDQTLFTWAQRVAKQKIGEGMRAEVYAGMIYERMGGRFEMYDVLNESMPFEADRQSLDYDSIDLSSLEVDGIDYRDAPEFSDAYFSDGYHKDGTPLEDWELEALTGDYDLLNQYVVDAVY